MPAVVNLGAAAAHASARIASAVAQAPIVAAATAQKAFAPILAPMAGLPAQLVYRFASFDPAATFADAMAAFAGESASVAPLQRAAQPLHRAWVITGAVLGADAILAARWYLSRRQAKKQAIAVNPESPQAGRLPPGL